MLSNTVNAGPHAACTHPKLNSISHTMRIGMFPGQLEALREEAQRMCHEERKRGARRAFLGLVLGGVSGGIGTHLLHGHSRAGAPQEPEPDRSPELERARQLALAPTEHLLDQQIPFVKAVGMSGRIDDVLAFGLARLLHLAGEDQSRVLSPVRNGILLLAEQAKLPRQLEPAVAYLRSRLR
jgi:hypothetical protein